MSDLVEFLRARLDDEEQAARYSDEHAPSAHMTDPNGEHHSPARVLADVEAKRGVLGLHERAGEGDCAHASDPCPTLRLLALPYADHLDYREDWRP